MLVSSSLSLLKYCPPFHRIIWGKMLKSGGTKSGLYCGWSNTSYQKCCRSLFAAAAVFKSDYCHEEVQSLMITSFFACCEPPFVDIEMSGCIRLLWSPWNVPWIALIPFRSQKTVPIHFLMQEVCFNLLVYSRNKYASTVCIAVSFLDFQNSGSRISTLRESRKENCRNIIHYMRRIWEK